MSILIIFVILFGSVSDNFEFSDTPVNVFSGESSSTPLRSLHRVVFPALLDSDIIISNVVV